MKVVISLDIKFGPLELPWECGFFDSRKSSIVFIFLFLQAPLAIHTTPRCAQIGYEEFRQ